MKHVMILHHTLALIYRFKYHIIIQETEAGPSGSVDIAAPSPVLSLDELHMAAVQSLPLSWTDLTPKPEGRIPVASIKLCKINSLPSSSTQPPVITHSLIVNTDFTWKLTIQGHEVLPASTTPISKTPEQIDIATLKSLLSIVDLSTVCPSNCGDHFVEMAHAHKGKFLSKTGGVRACLESGFPLSCDGNVISTTVRTSGCQMLTSGGRGSACNDYRGQLRMMHSKWTRKSPDSPQKFTNNRFLNTPQKGKKLKYLQTRTALTEKEVTRLRSKIGVTVDEPLHQELNSIMKEHNESIEKQFPEGTFRQLFWQSK